MKKKILVAGGAGFIGYHLCKRLLEDGNDVIVLDNMQTGTKENIWQLESIVSGLSDVSLRVLVHNVEDGLLTSFRILNGVNEIFNLACPASPPAYQKDAVKTCLTSVNGTVNLLELAKVNDARFLQASTSEIYGDALQAPQNEDYWGNVNPTGIRSCYDEGKRCAETLIMDYRRQYGVDAKIVRIFNTYGERMREDDGRVMTNFITQALDNKDITIYGDGGQTRSFMYVSDLIDGLLLMMKSKTATICNLGNPDERTISELAQKVVQLTCSKSRIVFCKLPKDDPRRRCPDISRAKTLLAWSPKVTLDEGLKKMIRFYGERRKI